MRCTVSKTINILRYTVSKTINILRCTVSKTTKKSLFVIIIKKRVRKYLQSIKILELSFPSLGYPKTVTLTKKSTATEFVMGLSINRLAAVSTTRQNYSRYLKDISFFFCKIQIGCAIHRS